MKRNSGTLEPWSTKEKLCLSSAVLKCGDQHWMSVSRQVRVFGEQDRPPEWYSQKQCALQYESLLNNYSASKRKKKSEKTLENMDVPGENIVKRLLQERLEELHSLLGQDRTEYLRIKKEMEDIESGNADDKLDEFEGEIEEEMEREAARASILRHHEERSRLESNEQVESKLPTSPLLTSLLQSPTGYRSTVHNQISPSQPVSRVNDSPTLSRLLECPAKPFEPTNLFRTAKKEPMKEESTQGISLEQMADPTELPSLTNDDISEVIEEVEADSPQVLMEVKQESLDNKDLLPDLNNTEDIEEVVEESTVVEIHEEVEIPIEPEEEVKAESPFAAKIDHEEFEQEQLSSVTQQDSDTMEEQPISMMDQQMVNMIVAGTGVISVNHDSSLEDVTLSDIQHEDDSETAYSVKEDSMDEIGDDSVKESSGENIEADSMEIEESETTNANQGVQLFCSTPDQLTEEDTDITVDDDGQKYEINENEKEEPSKEVEKDLKEAIIKEVEREVVNLGGSVVVMEGTDATAEESPTLDNVIIKLEDKAAIQKVVVNRYTDTPGTMEPNIEDQDKALIPQISVKNECAGEENDNTVKDNTVKDNTIKDSMVKEKSALVPKPIVAVEKETVPRRGNKRRYPSGGDPNSPSCHLVEDTKEYRAWKKSIMLVFNRMATHKYASMFLRPITNEQAPAYDTVIHRPVDLSTIKKKIETGELRTTVEFQRDLLLMFQNAMMYNDCRSQVYEMATVMQKECMQHIELMVEAMGEGVPWRKDSRGRGGDSSRCMRALVSKEPLRKNHGTAIKKEPLG